MGINLTQRFIYETDDLKSLDAILSAAVRVMLPCDNKTYDQLWLRTEKPIGFVETD